MLFLLGAALLITRSTGGVFVAVLVRVGAVVTAIECVVRPWWNWDAPPMRPDRRFFGDTGTTIFLLVMSVILYRLGGAYASIATHPGGAGGP